MIYMIGYYTLAYMIVHDLYISIHYHILCFIHVSTCSIYTFHTPYINSDMSALSLP